MTNVNTPGASDHRRSDDCASSAFVARDVEIASLSPRRLTDWDAFFRGGPQRGPRSLERHILSPLGDHRERNCREFPEVHYCMVPLGDATRRPTPDAELPALSAGVVRRWDECGGYGTSLLRGLERPWRSGVQHRTRFRSSSERGAVSLCRCSLLGPREHKSEPHCLTAHDVRCESLVLTGAFRFHVGARRRA
jgi:hypothetical protein